MRWKHNVLQVVKVGTVIASMSCIALLWQTSDRTPESYRVPASKALIRNLTALTSLLESDHRKSLTIVTSDRGSQVLVSEFQQTLSTMSLTSESSSSGPVTKKFDYWKGSNISVTGVAVGSTLSDASHKKWTNNRTTFILPPVSMTATSTEHLYLAIKTTHANHDTRLKLQLMTWISLAKQSTFVFTDCDDAKYQSMFDKGHFINTKCGTSHDRAHLVCKTSVEYNHFVLSNGTKRWFCSLDDDSYVNVPNLIKLLRKFDHTKKIYIGKISMKTKPSRKFNNVTVIFQFGTGGAMWCMSKALAFKIAPYAAGEGYKSLANQLGFTDDVAIGFMICHFAKTDLTESPLLHSHLELLSNIRTDALKDQITFSYSPWNVINTTGLIPNLSKQDDPTRLLTLHSYLFPDS